jgi:hypothetical protein
VRRSIPMQDLNRLSDYIVTHDSHGGDGAGAALNNCSSFAAGGWNLVNPWNSDVLAGLPPTPTGVYYSIMQNGSHQGGTAMDIPWSGRGVLYGDGRRSPKPSTQYGIQAANPTPDIIGSGVSVVNNAVTGGQNQWGHLDGFAPTAKTWVLSTGDIANAVGVPSANASTDLGGAGNPTLDALISGATRDAASYRVTVVPSGSILHVRYAFASEEYPEYVGSQYNDVMGIFVKDSNCALVPGTSLSVAVNNVNAGVNSAYYVDNSTGAAGYQTSFDGLTTPLECSVPVVKGQQVTIEIAVADTGDGILDSAVAILDGGIFAT